MYWYRVKYVKSMLKKNILVSFLSRFGVLLVTFFGKKWCPFGVLFENIWSPKVLGTLHARIIVLDAVVYGCSMRVINCYAPTEDATDSAKNTFYQTLGKQLKTTSLQKTICIGDFNATTSAAWYNSSLREKTVIEDLEVNNNGDRFHSFFNSYCMSVLNTWFSHKRCRRITWHSADGKTKKVYDFILCCSWLRQYVTNCRVHNSYDFDSDHRLVIAKLNTPCTKVSRCI